MTNVILWTVFRRLARPINSRENMLPMFKHKRLWHLSSGVSLGMITLWLISLLLPAGLEDNHIPAPQMGRWKWQSKSVSERP